MRAEGENDSKNYLIIAIICPAINQDIDLQVYTLIFSFQYGNFFGFFGELLKGSLTSYACKKKIERETNDYNLLQKTASMILVLYSAGFAAGCSHDNYS